MSSEQLRRLLDDITIEDVHTVIDFLPQIVAWFRARRHNREQIERDFERHKLANDEAYESATKLLEDRFPEG